MQLKIALGLFTAHQKNCSTTITKYIYFHMYKLYNDKNCVFDATTVRILDCRTR